MKMRDLLGQHMLSGVSFGEYKIRRGYNKGETANTVDFILDNEINGKILNKAVEEIALDKQKMINMGINALKNSTKDAEDKIYKEIKKLVK